MLRTKHRNFHAAVAKEEHLFIHTHHLMSQNDSEGVWEFLIVGTVGIASLFECENGKAIILKFAYRDRRVLHLMPLNRLFRSERNFRNLRSGWSRRNSTQVNLFHPEAIRGPKDGADIGQTANIVENENQIGPGALFSGIRICPVLVEASFAAQGSLLCGNGIQYRG